MKERLCQFVQELLRGSQVGSCEPFGEPAIDGSQLIACIAMSTLAAPQAGEAGRGPQFPRQNLLPARPVERLQKLRFGGSGVRCSLAKEKLALDAQQLRQVPELFAAMAPLERLVDCRATACDLSGFAQALCQCGEKKNIARFESRLRKLVESSAQSIQPTDYVALFDAQHAVETTPRGMQRSQRMPRGVIKQHRHITLCHGQIAYEQRNRARALTERIAQGKLVIEISSILDVALGDAHGLVWTSLQPKNRCQGIVRQHPLIVAKTDDVQSVNRRDIEAEHGLDMASRTGLVSEQMQREADHAIADENIPGIGRLRSNLLEPPCEGQHFAQVSIGQPNGPEPGDGAQL